MGKEVVGVWRVERLGSMAVVLQTRHALANEAAEMARALTDFVLHVSNPCVL